MSSFLGIRWELTAIDGGLGLRFVSPDGAGDLEELSVEQVQALVRDLSEMIHLHPHLEWPVSSYESKPFRITADAAREIAMENFGGPELQPHLDRVMHHIAAMSAEGKTSIANVLSLDNGIAFKEMSRLQTIDLMVRLTHLGFKCSHCFDEPRPYVSVRWDKNK